MPAIPILRYEPKIVEVCPLVKYHDDIHLVMPMYINWEWVRTVVVPEHSPPYLKQMQWVKGHYEQTPEKEFVTTIPLTYRKQKFKEPMLPLKTREVFIEDKDEIHLKEGISFG